MIVKSVNTHLYNAITIHATRFLVTNSDRVIDSKVCVH